MLSVDEKSQIQALDRTQPGLPLKKGRAGTVTHDYKRHGTTTLFAALNVLDGTVIGRNMQRHRHQEFIRFLNQIDQQTPFDLTIHLILDNYGTHKHAKVARWLDKHPRFRFHFIPTSSSWLNVVERFFRDLTTDRIRRDSFTSVPDLIAAIHDYIDAHNEDPRPFIWTAEADKIVADALALANENDLNNYGYTLLNQGENDKAIEILTLNTQRNPKSANAWDSLGEAYAIKGDKKNAIVNFKKSLSMNPSDGVKANSEKFLKQLGAM